MADEENVLCYSCFILFGSELQWPIALPGGTQNFLPGPGIGHLFNHLRTVGHDGNVVGTDLSLAHHAAVERHAGQAHGNPQLRTTRNLMPPRQTYTAPVQTGRARPDDPVAVHVPPGNAAFGGEACGRDGDSRDEHKRANGA